MNNALKNGQSDKDLEQFCFINGIHLDGIMYINDLDLTKKGSYILNLDNQNKGGTHWVALILKRSGFYYFDPFGWRPPINIENYCKKNKIKCFFNLVQIQHLDEKICGFYCCLFLYISQNIFGRLENKKDFFNVMEEYKYWTIEFKENNYHKNLFAQ